MYGAAGAITVPSRISMNNAPAISSASRRENGEAGSDSAVLIAHLGVRPARLGAVHRSLRRREPRDRIGPYASLGRKSKAWPPSCSTEPEILCPG
jgi:hypothetical protein